MGVKALERNHRDLIEAIWYKKADIDSKTGVGTDGRHIRVRMEDKEHYSVNQPIMNLMTDESNMLVSTDFNYDYQKYDELYMMGARWQILEKQIDYFAEQSYSLVAARYRYRVYIVVVRLAEARLWGR